MTPFPKNVALIDWLTFLEIEYGCIVLRVLLNTTGLFCGVRTGLLLLVAIDWLTFLEIEYGCIVLRVLLNTTGLFCGVRTGLLLLVAVVTFCCCCLVVVATPVIFTL